MGIDLNSAQLLIQTQKSGVSFERMATLGRQRLTCDRQALLSLLQTYGYALPEDRVTRFLDPTKEYAEEFLSILGAKDLFAVDASDFEGAQIIHDMNRQIPDVLDSSFDVVLDGGTLEHIFNLPAALGNATRMVRLGEGLYPSTRRTISAVMAFISSRQSCITVSCVLKMDTRWSPAYCGRTFPGPISSWCPIRMLCKIESILRRSSVFTYMYRRPAEAAYSRGFIPQQSDYARLWEKQETNGARPTQTSSRTTKLKATLKQIPALRTAVQSARAASRYRNLKLKRNIDGYLTILKDLKVMR